MKLYLRDVTYFDWRSGELTFGNMVVEEGEGRAARFTTDEPEEGSRALDCGGMLAMEGLACGHHHIYSALARGMPAPPRSPSDFAEILELVWWRLDKCLDLDMIRASALATAIDCLRCGVTRVIDHHASPNAALGSLSTIADALEEASLTHVLSLELSDRDGRERGDAGLAETEAYLSSGRPAMVGLHASFTVGDELLASAVDLAKEHGTGLHVHVAEDEVDQKHCLERHGQRVIERFAKAGVLDREGTILVHCLHLSDTERRLLRESRAWVAHNPESNQNNAVGSFRFDGLEAARVMIGTDGMHSDVIRSARAAFLVGQSVGLPNAYLPWRALWNNISFLESHHPGAMRKNDIVLFAYDPPTPIERDNLIGHAFFGIDSRHVRTVIANGRVVLEDGRLVQIDENEILRECRVQARRLWSALTSKA